MPPASCESGLRVRRSACQVSLLLESIEMQSTNIPRLSLRALRRQLAVMPTEEFARLTQAELDTMRARFDHSWRVRFGHLVWPACMVMGTLAMALWGTTAVLAANSLPLGLSLGVVALSATTGSVSGFFLALYVPDLTGIPSLQDASDSLMPLSQVQGSCELALKTLDNTLARRYRNTVLDAGRELCKRDLTYMEQLWRDDLRLAGHTRACREIHLNLA